MTLVAKKGKIVAKNSKKEIAAESVPEKSNSKKSQEFKQLFS